ncbi:MAG: hypothetical protein ACNA7K_05530 [Acholeplasmataceae bacterium]
MDCLMCHHQHDDHQMTCPYCGHENNNNQHDIIITRFTQHDTYLTFVMLGLALLTVIFGVLSLYQPSLAVLSFLGITTGLVGILLNKYRKQTYVVTLKIGYFIIVFGFLFNVFIFFHSFVAIFTDLF